MAATVAKFAAKKYLGAAMDEQKRKKPHGDDDPFFTYKKMPNGKTKKVKKQIPDFIPEHDAKILAKAKKSAYRLDLALFNLGPIRFGYSSVIGIIPEIGDVIDMFMAVRVYRKCTQVDAKLPDSLRFRMILNIIIDFVIGLVPFIGDLADAAFKCNTKNVALLEKHLIKAYKPTGMKTEEAELSRLEEFPDEDPPPYDQSAKSRKPGAPPNHATSDNRQSTGVVRN